MRCLVLGATGHVGRQLIPALLGEGHQVRGLVRSPADGRLHACPGLEIVAGDALDEAAVTTAMAGVDTVYHLVHALGSHDFAARDREAAAAVAASAEAAGVGRLIYLGGLMPSEASSAATGPRQLSAHLASRGEVGRIFLESSVPTAALQASIIIGSGSASFELLRSLANRARLLLLPGWAQHRTQPIATGDVVHYLVRSATLPPSVNRTFDIGGPDVVSYRQLIQRYARAARLPRPVFAPAPQGVTGPAVNLAGVLGPVPARQARPLTESLAHDMVCQEQDLQEVVGAPRGGPTSLDRALLSACRPSGPAERPSRGQADLDGFTDDRVLASSAPPERLWDVISGIGGDAGWHTVPGVWTLRGLLDQVVGGPGLYRGRSPELRDGDVIDFWRIRHHDARDRRLVLRAEMRMPGTATLELSANTDPERPGSSLYRQRVVFAPTGLAGRLYWWLQRPAHEVVFSVMAHNIVAHAEERRLGLLRV